MKRIFQKFLCLALIISVVFSIEKPIFASNSFEMISLEKNEKQPISVYSEEFPEAYIITEVADKRSQFLMNENLVTATVFVEETYSNENGEPVIVNSRLLSKDEVERIGVENFENLDTMPSPMASAINRRGKLTITFSGTHTFFLDSVKLVLNANAKWYGFDLIYNSENHPAVGKDFMGVTWSGDFRVDKDTINARANLGFGQTMGQNVYKVGSSPNAGRVWAFDEYLYAGGDDWYYVDNVDLSMTLWKDKMTGNGNKAEAVLQYIHTWQQVTGSVNVNPSGGGFSISATPKQWSIVCTVSNIPY